MELVVRQATAADKAIWNKYVYTHPMATPYHNYAWVESVVHAYGHPSVSLLALADDKVVGVLPIIKINIPLSGTTLCSLPYCDVGYALANNDRVTAALLQGLEQLKHESNARRIEYRDTATDTRPESDEKMTGKKVRMLLALPEASELLMKSFKSKLRSQIHKAEKNGLTYQLGNSPALIDAFYDILTLNMRRLGSPIHSSRWFHTLRNNYQDDILVSIVYTDDTPIGGGIVLRNNQKACIPWASTLAEYNRLAPNMLLYWSLLKEVTDTGSTEFDFGRSTFGEGTFKFKQQWGAQPQALEWFLPGESNSHPDQPSEMGRLRSMIENIWRRLPVGVTRVVGPKVRKYISL